MLKIYALEHCEPLEESINIGLYTTRELAIQDAYLYMEHNIEWSKEEFVLEQHGDYTTLSSNIDDTVWLLIDEKTVFDKLKYEKVTED